MPLFELPSKFKNNYNGQPWRVHEKLQPYKDKQVGVAISPLFKYTGHAHEMSQNEIYVLGVIQYDATTKQYEGPFELKIDSGDDTFYYPNYSYDWREAMYTKCVVDADNDRLFIYMKSYNNTSFRHEPRPQFLACYDLKANKVIHALTKEAIKHVPVASKNVRAFVIDSVYHLFGRESEGVSVHVAAWINDHEEDQTLQFEMREMQQMEIDGHNFSVCNIEKTSFVITENITHCFRDKNGEDTKRYRAMLNRQRTCNVLLCCGYLRGIRTFSDQCASNNDISGDLVGLILNFVRYDIKNNVELIIGDKYKLRDDSVTHSEHVAENTVKSSSFQSKHSKTCHVL